MGHAPDGLPRNERGDYFLGEADALGAGEAGLAAGDAFVPGFAPGVDVPGAGLAVPIGGRDTGCASTTFGTLPSLSASPTYRW